MKHLISLLALLLIGGAAMVYGAFTDDLTVDSKIAFVGDSWTSNAEKPSGVGGVNYTYWSDSAYFSQSAEWAYRLCQNVGWRNYRVFATGGAQVRHDGTGIAQYMPDVIAYDPDLVVILAGINDCADASDYATATSIGVTVVDSLQAMMDDAHAIDAKVAMLKLHPCCSFDAVGGSNDWTAAMESTRVYINSWIVDSLTAGDSLLIHTDTWLDSIAGQFDGTSIDSTVIKAAYNYDEIHLNQLGNFYRGDSLWVNSFSSLTFTDAAQTFHVDWDDGHDWSNDGLSSAAPFKTLQQALFRVRPGDTVECTSDTVDIVTGNTNECFAEIIHHGRSGSQITLDFNGGAFENPHSAASRKPFYFVFKDSSYYTTDSSQVYYVIQNATFRGNTYGSYMLGWGGVTFDGCSFFDDYLYLNASTEDTAKSCTFWAEAIKTSGACDAYVEECAFNSAVSESADSLASIVLDLNHTAGPFLLLESTADIDSLTGSHYFMKLGDNIAGDLLVLNNKILHNMTATTSYLVYVNSGANEANYAIELQNNILSQDYSTCLMFILREYPSVTGGNFMYAERNDAYFADGAKTIAQWRTGTGEDNDWDYEPDLATPSDTIKYGGFVPSYYDYAVRDHSSDWMSIYTTQYDYPTVPETFSTLKAADVLPRNISWKWSVGDTLGGTARSDQFSIRNGNLLLEYIDYRVESDSLYIQCWIKWPSGWLGGLN